MMLYSTGTILENETCQADVDVEV